MFVNTWTAHEENEILLNTDNIIFVKYYPESNMSEIATVVASNPVWVDGNFIDILQEKLDQN